MSSQLSSASQIAFPFIKKDEVLISEQLVKGSKVCKTPSEWFSSKSTQEHQPGSPSCPVDQLKLSFHDRTHAAFLPILPGEKKQATWNFTGMISFQGRIFLRSSWQAGSQTRKQQNPKTEVNLLKYFPNSSGSKNLGPETPHF